MAQIDRLDGLSSSTAIKGPCRVATTGNILLFDLQTVDGVALNEGDRVLVRAQTDARENGIYVAGPGQWRRTKDFSSNRDVRKGTRIVVTDGVTYATSEWIVTTANPVVLDTSSIGFAQIFFSTGAAVEINAPGWITKDTLDDLNTVTPENENYGGMVLDDADPANNGFYYRSALNWVKGRSFPDTVAELTVTGGTVNAVEASTGDGVDPAVVKMFYIDIPSDDQNTGDVTIAIDGDTALPVYDYDGSQMALGRFRGRLVLTNEGSSLKAVNNGNRAPTGMVGAETKDGLDAITPATESYTGVVLNDPDVTKNGYYIRESSAWVRQRGFPDTFARVTLGGAANAQTGLVQTGVDPSQIEVFIAFVTTPNTGAMTLSVAGETPRPVLNVAGNPLSGGEWTGVVLFVLNDDGDYQLIIDAGAAAAAAQSASEAAAEADRAEVAADSVQGLVDGEIRRQFTATDGQTVFAGEDDNGSILSYVPENLHVFLNGVRQNSADYTATDGETITLEEGANEDDILVSVSVNRLTPTQAANDTVDARDATLGYRDESETFRDEAGASATAAAASAASIEISTKAPIILTSSDDYTPSVGTTAIIVELVGGGGPGGRAGSTGATEHAYAGGGGGGGYAKKWFDVEDLTTPVTVTIGAGGTPGSSPTAGGTTSFGAYFSATGGQVGLVRSASGDEASGGGGGTGGLGVDGDINLRGANGGSGLGFSSRRGYGGAGGASHLGAGAGTNGVGSVSATSAGSDGNSYGGGASGGANSGGQSLANGGAGAPGVCIIWEIV